MSLFHIIAIPLFIIAALEILLGIILLRNNPRKNIVLKVVAALSFCSGAFSLLSAAMYMRASLGLPIDVTARLNWIGWFTVPMALQIVYFLKDERSVIARRIGLILYPVWAFVLGLCLFTDLIVTPGYSVIPFVNHPGPLENVARLFGSLLAMWLLYAAYRVKEQLRGLKKAQLNYFFQGVLIFGGGAAFTAGFLQVFGGFGFEPGLSAFFSLPWVALTYYAITRHRLFDIQLIFSRVLAVTLLVLLFSAVQITLFKLLMPALGEALSILISLSVVGTVFSVTRINRKTHQWLQELVLQDKYDYQSILKESIKASVTILHFDELMKFIIDSVNTSLETDSVCLFLKRKDGTYVMRIDKRSPRADFGSVPAVPAVVASCLITTGHAVVREELEDLLAADDAVAVNNFMQSIGSELLVPLIYKQQIQGFLSLGQKGTRESYLQSDIDLLELLAGQTAIALENAQLYEEARKARGSMRETEAKFQTLAETAAIGIFIHQGGNFLYANPAAEVIGGYTVHEYLSMNFMGLVHPDFVDLVKTRARDRLDGTKRVPAQYEFKIVRKNQEHRWVLMTAGVSEFEGKSAVIGTLIDITERKHAEEEREEYFRQLQMALKSLKESELRFRALAESTTAAIFIHQGQKLVYANRAGTTMTGYSNEELLREDFWALIHPEYQEGARDGISRLSFDQLGNDYEYKFIKKNGDECWVSMTAGFIEYGGKPAIIATLFDITDWKRAEEAKVRFYEQSVRLYEERIEEEKRHRLEKEKILMDLHDGIGGITTNISILSDLALNAKDDDIRSRRLATIAQLAKEGIAEIRGFMHSLDSKELNWRTLGAELRKQGANMVETHNVSFTIETDIQNIAEQPGSLTWVTLFKIYKEALTNVVKHARATAVNVQFRVTAEVVHLTIEDNGIGLNPVGSGGRGLANMRTRAEDVGGFVAISNHQGTTVHFSLPLPLKYPAGGMATQQHLC